MMLLMKTAELVIAPDQRYPGQLPISMSAFTLFACAVFTSADASTANCDELQGPNPHVSVNDPSVFGRTATCAMCVSPPQSTSEIGTLFAPVQKPTLHGV